MKEVFQEYGGVIVTIIAIIALVSVITALIGNGEGGLVYGAFEGLINSFLEQAELTPAPGQ